MYSLSLIRILLTIIYLFTLDTRKAFLLFLVALLKNKTQSKGIVSN